MKHLPDMRRTFPQIPTRDTIMGLARTGAERKVQRKQATQLATRVTLALRPGSPPLAGVTLTLAVSSSVGDCLLHALAQLSAMPELHGRVPTWDPNHLCLSFADSSGALAGGHPPELPLGEQLRTVLRACTPFRAVVTLRRWYLESESLVADEQAERGRILQHCSREAARFPGFLEQGIARARRRAEARAEFDLGAAELNVAEEQGRARVLQAEQEEWPAVELLFRDVFREHMQRALANLSRLRLLRTKLREDLVWAEDLHDSIPEDEVRVKEFPLEQLMPQLPPPGDPLSPPMYPPRVWRRGPGRFADLPQRTGSAPAGRLGLQGRPALRPSTVPA
eukprot:TRINITY_DN61151_c0_g1_i1.p1 TRINITY_DN61151_c0_g1~~TRINITY_DN61151_c0_g1_i1.p1  ORF type:complete len:372 (+),score=99.95 TRINITY_DN61151_c0_g1_i1:107-1117(+)